MIRLTNTFLAATLALSAGNALTTALTPAHAQAGGPNHGQQGVVEQRERPGVTHNFTTVDYEGQALDIFYREAGNPDNPTLLLLHGFPTSSQMFRDLIPQIASEFHVIAPDFPGYGHSSAPDREDFDYTFDNLAGVIEAFLEDQNIDSFAVYVMDYGAPVGYRLFEADPTRVTGLIIQNGNAYDEGLDNPFWEPIKTYWKNDTKENREALRGLLSVDATRWQYTVGTRNPAGVSPDTWITDQYFLDRPGNQEIQLDLFYDYRTNVPRYPVWQELFRTHQPPAIVVWGKNDPIFPDAGAYPYLRDLKDIEFHLFNTGHFALEEDGDTIAMLINDFLKNRVTR